MCFHTAVYLLLLLCFVAQDMRTRADVAALGKPALQVTLGTWGYWREPEGKSRGPWPVRRSLLRAPLWQEIEKGKPVSPQIANLRRHLGTEATKSGVLPAAAGVTGAFKTAEQQVTLCGTCHPVMHFLVLFCCCLREASRKDGCQRNGSCSAACNTHLKNCPWKQLRVDRPLHTKAQMLEENKSRGFPEKAVDFYRHKSFLGTFAFVKNKPKQAK